MINSSEWIEGGCSAVGSVRSTGLLAAVAALLLCSDLGAMSFETTAFAAQPTATAWRPGHGVKTRLLVGAQPQPKGIALFAGFEMKMEPGWKTYWRTPGDAGGIPPYFNWSKSENVRSAQVHYPVPTRFVEPVGTTFGYKKSVVFPVSVTPQDPSRPVTFRLSVDFGICAKICVPAFAEHELKFQPNAVTAMPLQLVRGLQALARDADQEAPANGPRLVAAIAKLSGGKPGLEFKFTSKDAPSLDVFVEPPKGQYLGVTRRMSISPDGAVFKAPITAAEDGPALRGKAVRVTARDSGGAITMTWTVPE